jgi:hypothetical protein
VTSEESQIDKSLLPSNRLFFCGAGAGSTAGLSVPFAARPPAAELEVALVHHRRHGFGTPVTRNTGKQAG